MPLAARAETGAKCVKVTDCEGPALPGSRLSGGPGDGTDGASGRGSPQPGMVSVVFSWVSLRFFLLFFVNLRHFSREWGLTATSASPAGGAGGPGVGGPAQSAVPWLDWGEGVPTNS